MVQDIIVILILMAVIISAGFSIYRKTHKKETSSSCGGCTGCSLSSHKGGCH